MKIVQKTWNGGDNLSNIKSKIYRIALVIIVLGYSFFFTSKFFFREEKSLLYTDLQTEQSLSNEVSLTLQKWIYSAKENSMMVMFTAENESLQEVELNWATFERHTNHFMNIETGSIQSELETEIIYPFENIIVVNITSVPENFEEIALSLQLKSENDDISNSIVQFYTNRNYVESVEKIGTYTDIDYRIEYLNIQKTNKETSVKELSDENQSLISDNIAYKKSMENMIENQKFETVAEIEETDSKIKAYQQQIDSNEDVINKNKYKILDLQSEIDDIETAIQKLKARDKKWYCS